MPVAPEPSPPPALLEVESYDPADGRLDAHCDRCDSTRVVILTASLPVMIDSIEIPAAGRARFDVPADLLRGLARLDDGAAFLWVEEPGAVSSIARFALTGDVAQNVADAAVKIRRDRNDAKEDER
jgi:hypothetical protein